LGKSFREGDLSKRSNDDYRGRSIFIRAPFICDIFKFHHNRKWFVIKDSYFVYMQTDSAVVRFPMLIDQGFSLDRRFRKTGTKNGIRIKNLQRLMIIKCQKEDERDEWFDSLMEIKNKSLFTQKHSFRSFAPKRQHQHAQWFANGQSYMEALAKAILSAREEIFITDWWLSPEIMLIRPFQDDSMRLDNLLGKRAVSSPSFSYNI
jgi:phospholipase D1/2